MTIPKSVLAVIGALVMFLITILGAHVSMRELGIYNNLIIAIPLMLFVIISFILVMMHIFRDKIEKRQLNRLRKKEEKLAKGAKK